MSEEIIFSNLQNKPPPDFGACCFGKYLKDSIGWAGDPSSCEMTDSFGCYYDNGVPYNMQSQYYHPGSDCSVCQTPDCNTQYPIEFSLTNCQRTDNILTVTNNYAIPVTFYAEGDCGDEIIFNGQIYEEGQHIYPWPVDACGLGLPLNGNHHFIYTQTLQPGQSVSIGGRDNGFGGGTSGYYTLCPQ